MRCEINIPHGNYWDSFIDSDQETETNGTETNETEMKTSRVSQKTAISPPTHHENPTRSQCQEDAELNRLMKFIDSNQPSPTPSLQVSFYKKSTFHQSVKTSASPRVISVKVDEGTHTYQSKSYPPAVSTDKTAKQVFLKPPRHAFVKD